MLHSMRCAHALPCASLPQLPIATIDEPLDNAPQTSDMCYQNPSLLQEVVHRLQHSLTDGCTPQRMRPSAASVLIAAHERLHRGSAELIAEMALQGWIQPRLGRRLGTPRMGRWLGLGQVSAACIAKRLQHALSFPNSRPGTPDCDTLAVKKIGQADALSASQPKPAASASPDCALSGQHHPYICSCDIDRCGVLCSVPYFN